MRKTITYFLYILILGLFLSSGKAYAHVLRYTKTMGIILHINPDDEPIAGSQSLFIYSLNDKEGKFYYGNCDCTVTIFSGSQAIYKTELFQEAKPDSSYTTMTYTFPSKGIYKLVVDGIPNKPNAFTTFSISFDIRVDREILAAGKTQSPLLSAINFKLLFLIVPFILLLLVLAYLITKSLSVKNKNLENGK